MSIVQRGNTQYWYIQFQLNGQTYIRSSRSTSKKAAEQMETELKARMHSQQFLGQKESISIRSAIQQYCESRKDMPSYRSVLSCAKTVIRLLHANKRLTELSSHDLERFKSDRMAEGVGPQTIKHDLNVIRGAWKFARKLGFQVNDLAFPQMKVPKTSLRYLTDTEERRLLDCLDPKREGSGLRPFDERDDEMKRTLQDAYDLVVLLLDTGARYSEIANIEWPRINLTDRTINLWRSKVQNETVLYMTDRVYEILSRRMQNQFGQYVFRSRNGGARGYASQSIRKALRKAGLHDCRIHTLRHTYASRLIQNGMSVYEVREILGHSDIKTTMRYAHLESKQVTSKARDVMNRFNQKSEE